MLKRHPGTGPTAIRPQGRAAGAGTGRARLLGKPGRCPGACPEYSAGEAPCCAAAARLQPAGALHEHSANRAGVGRDGPELWGQKATEPAGSVRVPTIGQPWPPAGSADVVHVRLWQKLRQLRGLLCRLLGGVWVPSICEPRSQWRDCAETDSWVCPLPYGQHWCCSKSCSMLSV